MHIKPIVGESSVVFPFDIGCLKSALITFDQELFINGHKRDDWGNHDQNYAKPQNQFLQKQPLRNPFRTGDELQPILTASKGADGRIFLRLYRNDAEFKAYRCKALWEGSLWNKRGQILIYSGDLSNPCEILKGGE